MGTTYQIASDLSMGILRVSRPTALGAWRVSGQKNKKAERAGFDQAEILKVLRTLYLCLKAGDDRDLESLVDALKGYGFLLFHDEE